VYVLEINVKNPDSYNRQLQVYQTYYFIEIPAKTVKRLKNASENAIHYYEKCGFVVEKVTKGMVTLNEVPDITEEKREKIQNLNEVGIKKAEEPVGGKDIREAGIKEEKPNTDSILLQTIKDYDSELLRALLLEVGTNPRNLQNKDKLIQLVMEQDRQKVMTIISDSE